MLSMSYTIHPCGELEFKNLFQYITTDFITYIDIERIIMITCKQCSDAPVPLSFVICTAVLAPSDRNRLVSCCVSAGIFN